MKTIAYAFSLACAFCVLFSAGPNLHAQGSQYVRAVPNCGQQVYDQDTLTIENQCDIAVNIVWTSSGNVWGSAQLEPGRHQSTGSSRDDVARAGGVDLFTCPGSSTPEGTDGKFVGGHYKGEYRCKR
jgi:hypothetical protein